MRELDVSAIKQAVKQGFLEICTHLDSEIATRLQRECLEEPDPSTRFVLNIMTENARIAARECCPVCQDTGMAVLFLDVGQDVHVTGGDIRTAVNDGVREAYREGCFRKSVLSALRRVNTNDNTPAVVHFDVVPGDKIVVKMMAKGFGSENMSRIFMLAPSMGIEGVKDCIVQVAQDAGANPCPPIVLGVGIGGTMEQAALLSKKALFRNLNTENGNPILNEIEIDSLDRINDLKIGAMGLGGRLSAFKVMCLETPTHLAGLPVAITVQCHASRHKVVVL